MRANLAKTRASAARKDTLLNLEVEEFVVVARVNKRDELNKLVSTWTGPWREVSVGSRQHVYGVEDIVTGERKEVQYVHVARTRPQADESLAVTVEELEVFTTLENQ